MFYNSRLGSLEKSIAFFAKGIGKSITECFPDSCTLERFGVNGAAVRKQESRLAGRVRVAAFDSPLFLVGGFGYVSGGNFLSAPE